MINEKRIGGGGALIVTVQSFSTGVARNSARPNLRMWRDNRCLSYCSVAYWYNKCITGKAPSLLSHCFYWAASVYGAPLWERFPCVVQVGLKFSSVHWKYSGDDRYFIQSRALLFVVFHFLKFFLKTSVGNLCLVKGFIFWDPFKMTCSFLW